MTVGQKARSRLGQLRALFFDLDDTLYRVEAIPKTVRQKINEYMHAKLGVPLDQVEGRCTDLYMRYGTTLAGLVAEGHSIDFDDWHHDVHYGALDYQRLLRPDEDLRSLLTNIGLPKYILTNADKKHAQLCLDRMGIADCFQGIFDFEVLQDIAQQRGLFSAAHPGILCKPAAKAYEAVLQHAGGLAPSEAMLFDDSLRNIAGARALGMHTVLVGSDAHTPPRGAEHVVRDLHQLPDVLPELFQRVGGASASSNEAARVRDIELEHALSAQEEPVPVEVQA